MVRQWHIHCLNLSERGKLFIGAAVDVYEGMIIGLNNRNDDMVVNPCKNKKLTNTRSSGADDAIKLQKPKEFTLEEALEFIEDDEWVEITPDAIRLRKKYLSTQERNKFNKNTSNIIKKAEDLSDMHFQVQWNYDQRNHLG